MEDFVTWSGWAATIIATIIAVIQFLKKESYKKEVIQLKIEIGKIEKNTVIANDKGVAINKNRGDITIN